MTGFIMSLVLAITPASIEAPKASMSCCGPKTCCCSACVDTCKCCKGGSCTCVACSGCGCCKK